MSSFHNLGLFFEYVVLKNKNKTAIKYKNENITYNELNELSNQIAYLLLQKGLFKNDVVAIFNTKEKYSYASMIACLKLGLIYTNLDEDNPSSRFQKILDTSKPRIVITDHDLSRQNLGLIEKNNLQIVDLFNNFNELKNFKKSNLEITLTVSSNFPAYIMFTSGSTGIPKGVTISHSNIISFISWSIELYDIKCNDIFAQLSPMYFDNSVFDFYTAFFSGASLAPIKKDVLSNPKQLVSDIDELQCTIWFSVPSLLVYLTTMRVLTKENLNHVRIFTFGGEGFPKAELKKLFDLYSSNAQLINVYGPTEGTCICSSHEISDRDFEEMNKLAPLGKINKNFQYLILDENLNIITDGRKGELCLLGPNIALGYYNDLKRTSELFIQTPLQNNFKDKSKFVPEGVEGRVEYKGKVSKIIYQLQGGLRSSMGYIGAKSLKEINKKAKFVKITKAGFYESMVHSVEVTQKSINYKL